MASRGSEEYKKACARRAAEYRERNPERVKQIAARSKEKHREHNRLRQKERRATSPELDKAYRRKHYVKHRDSILVKQKENAEKNKSGRARAKKRWDELNADHCKEYRRVNKEQIASKTKRWQEANRDHVYAVACAWREKNRERVNLCASKNRRVNPERYRESQRRYHERHPESRRIQKQVRRARKLNATVGDTKAIAKWEKQWRARKANTCHWCKRKCKTGDCHSDHVVPLARGGEHGLDNLVISCAACNHKKNCKPPEVFNKQLEQPLLFI